MKRASEIRIARRLNFHSSLRLLSFRGAATRNFRSPRSVFLATSIIYPHSLAFLNFCATTLSFSAGISHSRAETLSNFFFPPWTFLFLSFPPFLKLLFRPNVREEVHLLTKYAREMKNLKSRGTGSSNFYENRAVQFRAALLAFSLLRRLTVVPASCIHSLKI